MSDANAVLQAIARWQATGLVDADTATKLRAEVATSAGEHTRRVSQYVLAATGAVVLVIAGGVFLDWAWPLLGDEGRAFLLALGAIVVLIVGARFESASRWLPAAYLMQTAGLALLLSAYGYSERFWTDGTTASTILGFISLATPLVLAPRAMRRSSIMPAVHFVFGLAFLAMFLHRSTSLSDDAIIWVLDAVLLGSILVLVAVIRSDPRGERFPWALGTFVTAMAAGFLLVLATALEVLSLSEDALYAVDAWLVLCAGLTLWGIHRAPEGLRRAWFGRLLTLEMLAWILFGCVTVAGPLDAGPELALLLVGGVGVAAFLYADRHGVQQLMAAASLGFIVPVWWWSVDRAGALGGVFALLLTAGFLFWASGRRGG